MVSSRTTTAVAGLLVSLLVSVVLWWYFDTFVFFLFVPFVPFLLRGGDRDRTPEPVRTCPNCGFRTTEDDYAYCPHDGARLQRREK
ncbi:MAG: hypothetical protein ABEI96_06215 [Haloarculaceae archaeon]